jgi:CheY-like chemotaxis protein
LVAEDNPVNQKVVLHMLGRLGYEADLCANGVEALEALKRQRYDLVLMDLQMPEMGGIEAARRIRQEKLCAPYLRIVALTAGLMGEDREKCLSAGLDDYLSKPVRIEELRRVLKQCHYNRAE